MSLRGKSPIGTSLSNTMQNLRHYLNVLLLPPNKATVLVSKIISVTRHAHSVNTLCT